VNRTAALTVGLILFASNLDAQDHHLRVDQQHTDSLTQGLAQALRGLTSPELEQRKARRRSLQQRGYATALQAELEGDYLSGLLAIVRAHLQIALHLPHTPLSVFYPVKRPPGWPPLFYEVVLSDDWSFPHDPWRKP
jgi:hypothetical protein